MTPHTIDLAPHNPYGLTLQTPAIALAAAGRKAVARCAGLPGIGAVVTAPIARRRTGDPMLLRTPAGLLLDEARLDRREALGDAAGWMRLSVPVLARIAQSSPEELHDLVLDFEDAGVQPAAFVLDAGEAEPALLAEQVEAIQQASQLPLLLALRASGQALSQTQAVLSGIDALLVTHGPPGAALEEDGALRRGWVDGAAAEPALLLTATELAQLTLPLACLAPRPESARTLLRAGAVAVLLRTALWRDPGCAVHIQD